MVNSFLVRQSGQQRVRRSDRCGSFLTTNPLEHVVTAVKLTTNPFVLEIIAAIAVLYLIDFGFRQSMERVILYTSPLSIALILWSTTLTDIHKQVSARLALSEAMRANLSISPGIGVWIICVTLIVLPSIILYQRAQRVDEALVISPIVPPFRRFLFAAFSLFVLTLVAPSLFQLFSD